MSKRMFNQTERLTLYRAANGKCQICGNSLPENWHADHVRPYSKGGVTELSNGQALCPTCNVRKSNMVDRINAGAGSLVKLNGSDMERLRKIYEGLSKEEKSSVKPLWASAKEDFSPLSVIRLLMSREENR